MNTVALIGRTTKDTGLRMAGEIPVANFTLAIDDGYGEKKRTNFISVVVFGKQAESCEKYLSKGKLVGVTGKIQTGSYKNKDGATVYTTDVVADRVEFLEWGEKKQEVPAGFESADDDDVLFR